MLSSNPERAQWCGDAVCKAQMRFEMLWALAAAGDRRYGLPERHRRAERAFDSATQIRLARYLLAVPALASTAASRWRTISQQTDYVTGRYAVANVATPWGWLGTSTTRRRRCCSCSVDRGAPPEQTDGAVRALVAQTCKCGGRRWTTPRRRWSRSTPTPPPNISAPASAGVAVGSKTIASATFGSTALSTFNVPVSSLSGQPW